MQTPETQRYFATCARGIEPILAGELRTLNAQNVELGRGGVSFAGPMDLLYRANLHLRTAVRVLVPLLQDQVLSTDELYDLVRAFDWSKYLTPAHTLAVDCNVRDSAITHSLFAARRVKDAICDQFLERCGQRPSVDTETPLLGLNLHIYANQAILSLDSSWDSLHKRGYRPIQVRAPLNEALAAALLLRTGWTGQVPLVDPLCGSGTIPIEAAWLALQRPPGLTRKRFGFMGWMDFDVALWTEIRDEARHQVLKALPAPILGFDRRRDAVNMSTTNARSAGIGHLLPFMQKELADFTPQGPPGIILTNPPYGERIGEIREVRALYQLLGEVLRQRCAGWQAWVFTSTQAPHFALGLEPRERIPLNNGKINCRLLRFDL